MTTSRDLGMLLALFAAPACSDDATGTATGGGTGSTASGDADVGTDATSGGLGEDDDGVDTTGATGPDGVDATDDATSAPDSSDSTESSPDDSGEDSGTSTGGEDGVVVAEPPTWLRSLDGLLSSSGPRLAVLPNGDLSVFASGGLYADEIVYDVGGPNEVVMPTPFVVSSRGVFDGQTGALDSARLLNELAGGPYGVSVGNRYVTVAGNGDTLVAGTWAGNATFFPDTADQQGMFAPMTLNGDTLDRAEEPYFYRMTPGGDVTWISRGRTPTPISTTWFNYAKGIAPLPGGDVLVAGDFEQSGFVVGDGLPGEYTATGSQGSYFARLDDSGAVVWAGRNAARLQFQGLRHTDDGAVYTLLPGSGGVLVDTDAPGHIDLEPGLQGTVGIGRIDPDGGMLWTATAARSGPGSTVTGYDLDAAGEVVIFGNFTGTLRVRGSDGLATEVSTEDNEYRSWLGRLDADGVVQSVTLLPAGADVGGRALGGDSGLWLHTRVPTPFTVEIDGRPFELPDLGYPEDSAATVLQRIDDSGTVTAVQVLGVNLGVTAMHWTDASQSSLFVSGSYWCDGPSPAVVDDAGTSLQPLPNACAEAPNDDRWGWVAAVPIAG